MTLEADYATHRGAPDGADFAYVVSLLGRYPASAIARMAGRSLSFVEQIADTVGYSAPIRSAPPFVAAVRGRTYTAPQENSPPVCSVPAPREHRRQAIARDWRQSMPPRARKAIQAVADRHGVAFDLLVAPYLQPGPQKFARIRQEAYCAVYDLRDDEGARRFSLPLIGAWFGGRDHTSVHHGIRQYREALADAERQQADAWASLEARKAWLAGAE
jgi:hypothetical protein